MSRGVGNLNVSVTASTRKARADLELLRKSGQRLEGSFGGVSRGLVGVGGGLRKLPSSSSVAGAGLGMVAGAAATALATFLSLRAAVHGVSNAMANLDNLGKTADKLGIGTKELAGLRLAASEAGVEVGKFDMSLGQMVRRISDAAAGTGEAVAGLRDLGLSAAAMNLKDPDEQLRAIVAALHNVKNPSDQARIAYDLFGRSGVDLLNVLRKDVSALDEAQQAAERLGIAVDRKSIAAVESANDAMGRMGKAGEGLANSLAVTLAPAVEGTAKFFTRMAWELNHGLGLLDGATDAADREAAAATRAAAAEASRAEALKKVNDEFRKQLAAIREQETVARGGGDQATYEADKQKFGIDRALALADARERVSDAKLEAAQLERIRDLRQEIEQFGMSDLAKRRAELVGHGFTDVIRSEADGLFAELDRLQQEEKQRQQDKKQADDERKTLATLQQRVDALGVDPLQAERDRTLAGITDSARRSEAAALFDKLEADQRRQTEARLAAEARQTRKTRRNDPLDANTAEGFAALRSSVGDSPQMRQLAEAQQTNKWLQEIALSTGDLAALDPGDVFSLN